MVLVLFILKKNIYRFNRYNTNNNDISIKYRRVTAADYITLYCQINRVHTIYGQNFFFERFLSHTAFFFLFSFTCKLSHRAQRSSQQQQQQQQTALSSEYKPCYNDLKIIINNNKQSITRQLIIRKYIVKNKKNHIRWQWWAKIYQVLGVCVVNCFVRLRVIRYYNTRTARDTIIVNE